MSSDSLRFLVIFPLSVRKRKNFPIQPKSNPMKKPNPNGSTDQRLNRINGHPVGQEKTKGNTLEPKLPLMEPDVMAIVSLLPPGHVPPPRNKGLIAGLIKGKPTVNKPWS